MLSSLAFVNPHRARAWTFRRVPAADPRPLPVDVRPTLDVEIGGGMGLPEFHAATTSTALLVLVDGVLVHEWYRTGLGPGDLFLGASATKSLLAHLVGIAARSAAVDLDAVVEAYVPELRDTGYRGVPVRDLLRMTSGVDWVEDHRDPHGQATALLSAFAARRSSRALLARIGPGDPPGSRYAYCTADSQVLDWVRERATGAPFPAALAELWRALGCTQDAVVAVDGDGVALAGGGVAAAAADWARVGLVQIDGGALVDRDWIDASARPSLPFLRPGRLPEPLSGLVGFGYHWWPLDDDGMRVSADGSRGQFVYVDRPRGVVVVKTSAWAYADAAHDRWCRDLSYRAFPVLVNAVAICEGVQR